MQATMIKIEMSAKMEKAIARCKANHPKVRRVDASTVKVFGNGGCYTVRFAEPRKGLKLASCDCKAGLAGTLCYHIPGALAAPVAVVSLPVVPSALPTPTVTPQAVPAPLAVLTLPAPKLQAVTSVAPQLPTMPAASACTLVKSIEQTYGGARVVAYYCDGWSV